MPDGDGGVGRQVDGRLHGEEAVDLPLRAELGAEVLDVHGHRLGVGLHLLVLLHWRAF